MEYDDLIFGELEKYRTIDGLGLLIKRKLYDEYVLKFTPYIFQAARLIDVWTFNYIFTELISDAEFGEYIGQVDQRKLYSTGVDIKNTDKIVTLSTCALVSRR